MKAIVQDHCEGARHRRRRWSGELRRTDRQGLGADVTRVCGPEKADLVRSLGAGRVIDYTHDDVTDGPTRFDVIVDTAGRRTLSHLRRALAQHGTIVIVGGEGGGRWLGGFDRGFRGQMMGPFVGERVRQLTAKVNTHDLVALKELIEAGKVTPVIDRMYPLREVREALQHWEHGHARGKIVISG